MSIQHKLDIALQKLENYSLEELKNIIESFGYDLNESSHVINIKYDDIDMKIVNCFEHFLCVDYSYFSSNDESMLEYAA
ncbi:hypothetical protein EIK76_05585 [Rheinheimera mesophila]|uniref:Uncharacterized protein n=1 Tax=Rheinheimera mesophila TaxID=1547515 RepID=A0A3P3QQS7_9GAMM|nr:hypothetical protein [Rheinheimera mesophila]KKL03244.1 hypothetical protein SD53_00320 [Rheinheimera mesophila]RRJ23537.1 hypothetical protein EIK76_05585 [Rheinheimera mesophila]